MKSKYPSVTVLLTLRNNKDTIKKCIDSLLKIDYSNYEIFVVDAFSNDGSYEILKSYGKKIILYQVKGWAPKAYNWALKRIKKEYVALIDADCTVPKNWLKELLNGFDSKDVVEVGGMCLNPKSKSMLQNLLGRELEDRFNHIGKYADKVPTMNVMFRTSLARKVRFKENLRVGYDVDFSFNMRKYGKIRFNKKAKINHYHRSTWKNLFKQQYNYALYAFLIYTRKIGFAVKGDQISKRTMMLQILMLYMLIGALIINFLIPSNYIILALFVTLFLSYIIDAEKLSRNSSEFSWYIVIFLYRNIAWNLGMVKGFFVYLKKYFK